MTWFVQRTYWRLLLEGLLVLWNVAFNAHLVSAEGAGRLMRVRNNRKTCECVRNAGL